MVTVLLVEDDSDMQNLLHKYLAGFDMKCLQAKTIVEAEDILKKDMIDIAVLDVMLPDGDGTTLCRKIREEYGIPVIISSAKGDLGSKIVGFEQGADDYLAKPYEPRELALRIDALLKRTKKTSIEIGEFRLDEEQRDIFQEGERLELTKSEYELLKLFLLHPNKAFSRSELAWYLKIADNPRTIDMHLSNIRAKIGDTPKESRYIKSVWGIGYKFVG
jgi:two-component system OmpR family response regulator